MNRLPTSFITTCLCILLALIAFLITLPLRGIYVRRRAGCLDKSLAKIFMSRNKKKMCSKKGFLASLTLSQTLKTYFLAYRQLLCHFEQCACAHELRTPLSIETFPTGSRSCQSKRSTVEAGCLDLPYLLDGLPCTEAEK